MKKARVHLGASREKAGVPAPLAIRGPRSQQAVMVGADVLLGVSEDEFPLVGSIPTHPAAICPLDLCLVSLGHVAAHTRVAGISDKVPDEDSCHDL